MKKLLTIIGISVFFVMIAVGAAYNPQFIHITQIYPNSENYDVVNSKGCPQFCPKDDKTILDKYKDMSEP